MVNQRELTEEGLEKNFATNTLGKTRTHISDGCFNNKKEAGGFKA